MPRKKKKPSAAQRKQDEIQRRIKAAEDKKEKEDNKEKPARRARTEKPAPPAEKPADAAAPGPVKTAEKRRAKAARPAMHDRAPAMSVLRFERTGDAGGDQCCSYNVTASVRLDIKSLFDAIRKERHGEAGVVYISMNLAEAGPGNYSLSYDYAGGMFTRREPLSGRKAAKNPPLMADILDCPVRKIRAHGGWGQMSWYVNIAPPDGSQHICYQLETQEGDDDHV